MAIQESEIIELVRLLDKLEWPLDPRVFRALLSRVVSVPIELVVFDDNDQVLMYWRKDTEYYGFHVPGTVLRDNEDVSIALQRLVSSEIVGARISEPTNIGWVEIRKGGGRGMNPTRHEISLVFVAHLEGRYRGTGGEFFPFYRLPPDTVPHHRVLVGRAVEDLLHRRSIAR